MTSRIIYHDFQKSAAASTNKPAPKVFLTAAVLAKGRRLAAANQVLNIACVTLCGACIGVSLLILTTLMFG